VGSLARHGGDLQGDSVVRDEGIGDERLEKGCKLLYVRKSQVLVLIYLYACFACDLELGSSQFVSLLLGLCWIWDCQVIVSFNALYRASVSFTSKHK
jgi:hypothetical protein